MSGGESDYFIGGDWNDLLHPAPAPFTISFGQSARGTPMDLGDGTILPAEEADKIRDMMDEASGKIPSDLAEAILRGMGDGARFDVATGEWSFPPLPARSVGQAEEVAATSGRWLHAEDPTRPVIPHNKRFARPVPQHHRGLAAQGFQPKPRRP